MRDRSFADAESQSGRLLIEFLFVLSLLALVLLPASAAQWRQLRALDRTLSKAKLLSSLEVLARSWQFQSWHSHNSSMLTLRVAAGEIVCRRGQSIEWESEGGERYVLRWIAGEEHDLLRWSVRGSSSFGAPVHMTRYQPIPSPNEF